MVAENMGVLHEIDTGLQALSRECAACRDQTRAMQSRVKVSRSAGMVAGDRDWASSGAACAGLNVVGVGGRADWGDKRFQGCGRSFVIHMLWNGFVLVLFPVLVVFAGAEACDAAGAGRLTVA